MSADEGTDRPALRIVRGSPSPDEVAALVAVVAAAGSAAARRSPRPSSSGWAARDRVVRQPLGTGGWRASAAPR